MTKDCMEAEGQRKGKGTKEAPLKKSEAPAQIA